YYPLPARRPAWRSTVKKIGPLKSVCLPWLVCCRKRASTPAAVSRTRFSHRPDGGSGFLPIPPVTPVAHPPLCFGLSRAPHRLQFDFVGNPIAGVVNCRFSMETLC
ncbi:unnamed protein product, partial [Laminaria digitata]